jgi:hypothetical protein
MSCHMMSLIIRKTSNHMIKQKIFNFFTNCAIKFSSKLTIIHAHSIIYSPSLKKKTKKINIH